MVDSPFGAGTETIDDKEIRKGWQIDPKYISVPNVSNFINPSSLQDKILDEITSTMCPPNHSVTAEFYKMLIYGPGGHFVHHKDTQRNKNHCNSTDFLHSGYSGGDFLLYTSQGKISVNFGMEATQSTECYWLAFYTDVDHEIQPIVKGYRVAASYNLYCQEVESKMSKTKKKVKITKIPPKNVEPIKSDVTLQNLGSNMDNIFNVMNLTGCCCVITSTLQLHWIQNS